MSSSVGVAGIGFSLSQLIEAGANSTYINTSACRCHSRQEQLVQKSVQVLEQGMLICWYEFDHCHTCILLHDIHDARVIIAGIPRNERVVHKSFLSGWSEHTQHSIVDPGSCIPCIAC